MWEFLTELHKIHGLAAVVMVVQAAIIVYFYLSMRRRDKDILDMAEKRREDALEFKKDYEDLSKKLENAMDILIKVFKQRNGG